MSDDKSIFKGDEDGSRPTDRPDPAKFDEGGFLPPGAMGQFQFLEGSWVPPEEPKFNLFSKIVGRIIVFAVTMVIVAGCVWLVAAIIANLPHSR